MHSWLRRGGQFKDVSSIWLYLMNLLFVASVSVGLTATVTLIIAVLFPLPLPPGIPTIRVLDVPQRIVAESTSLGISAHLPLALAWQESRFRPNAIGENRDATGRVISRDWGVFQLNDIRLESMHLLIFEALDPKVAVPKSVELLARYLELCGSEHAAVRAFATGRCR